MAFRIESVVSGLALFSCFGCAEQSDAGYPLLDGACDEYADLGVQTVSFSQDMTLFVFQDQRYVWLCASLPPESFGAVDLVVDSPGLEAPRNLHVSAQLGEWAAEDEDGAPETAESDRWWQITGWSANAVRFNGYQGEGDTHRAKFIPSEAREFQLSKAHFGRGPWGLRFEFGLIKSPNGDFESVIFPEDAASPFIIEAE
ncbi:hypothetical protein ACFOOP_03050 [Marinicaulis aureus]|uniref:Lipoprotein n=1 Tax=Hyphococcus aureus TaxID=2666033 RepID=A0ABW1KTB9_9PROT